MAGFIEDFYYGNIDPQFRGFRDNDPIKKVAVDINKLEEQLLERLQGDDKKLFLDFVNFYGELMGENALDSFTIGFRYGARFMMDTFLSDDAPFKAL